MRTQKKYSYRVNEDLLIKRMTEMGITWTDLDHLIGAQTGYMYQVMTSNKRVELKSILALAQVLSVKPEEISLDEIYEEKEISKPDMDDIDGEEFRHYADATGLSHNELARSMGLNHDDVNLIIGRETCEHNLLLSFANRFCISPSKLLKKARKEA